MVQMGGASSFENVREFLRYVQGDPESADAVPPGIVRDLEELEKRGCKIVWPE